MSFEYFDPVEMLFLTIRIHVFRGDVTDVSAKSKTLPGIRKVSCLLLHLTLKTDEITYVCGPKKISSG